MTVDLALDLAAKSGEAVKAGPIGLAVILILCIASYFLFKSMSKQLRKVRDNFPTEEPEGPSAGAQKVDLRKASVNPPDGSPQH